MTTAKSITFKVNKATSISADTSPLIKSPLPSEVSIQGTAGGPLANTPIFNFGENEDEQNSSNVLSTYLETTEVSTSAPVDTNNVPPPVLSRNIASNDFSAAIQNSKQDLEQQTIDENTAPNFGTWLNKNMIPSTQLPPRWNNILLYGPPGSGKTSFIGSIGYTNCAPVLVLDFEEGYQSLGRFPNIDVLPIRDFKTLRDIASALLNNEPALERYNTIALDSLTVLQEFADLEALQKYGKNGKEHTWEVWNEQFALVTNVIKVFRRWAITTKKLVIFTALMLENTDETTGVISGTRVPMVQGKKMPSRVAAQFDLVAALMPNLAYDPANPIGANSYNRLITTTFERTIARDRLDKLPPVMIGATFTDLLSFTR